MSKLTAVEIRESFLKFFESKGHRRVSSSSLVPHNDPTLLFTNAGMNQFKDVFTGREQRDHVRGTSAQKCVRAGGKHNDLDNVGFTARHHTFFEMLGNFSFGDYFKADAIAWAWEFVTQVLKISKDRLAVTVFKGEDGIEADEEAYGLWLGQGLAKDRVVRLGKRDNFWAMGDTGPCGPCSEIYFYLPEHPPKPEDKVGESDNWLEIWNLVFMQFERKADGTLLRLPRPSIDTGAGLERVSAVVQGKLSNYETDLFTPLLEKVAALAGKRYGNDGLDDASMRIIADHARATAFLVSDGVQPSNEGRGYVLRRIMRRAIRHGARLGLEKLFFHEAVDAVISMMGQAYPELRESRSFVLEATRHEEDSFRRTLARGLKMIDDEIEKLGRAKQTVIPGEVVFLLHGTHGFPWDLTQVIAREKGFDIDLPGYEARMEEERLRSDFKSTDQQHVGDVYLKVAGELPPTQFTGYEAVEGDAKVLTILLKGTPVTSAKQGDAVEVFVDRTPFYGESGGQLGDTGTLTGVGLEVQISDTQKPVAGLHAHHGKILQGTLSVGQTVHLAVDDVRRKAIRANHSATHLLHKALAVVLGDNVKQKGSVVAPDQLRFDYSAFNAPTPDQLEQVEDLVNGWIRDNAPAQTKLMGLEAARAAGAVALFGEKYGAEVRVVTVHPESTELCGGTHVHASGDIGLFKITQECSIASGVRRVVAVTGSGAIAWLREVDLELRRAAELLKVPTRDVVKRIEAKDKRLKELEAQVAEMKVKLAVSGSGSMQMGDATATGAGNVGTPYDERKVNDVSIRTQNVPGADVDTLRALADRYRDQLKSGVVGLGTVTADGKGLIIVTASKDLVERGFKSGDAVRAMAAELGGKGGGKPDFAQAGGPDAAKLPTALSRLYELVKL